MIAIDGGCSRPVIASRGITAGSGHACDELMCLMKTVCDTLVNSSPSLGLTQYVDDITCEHEDFDGEKVSDRIAADTAHADALLTARGFQLSPTKNAVTASSYRLARVAADNQT